MQFSLIGMSGAGKSFWSKKIESKGYLRYSCDDLIAERLGLKLEKRVKSTKNLAKWMGEPFSKGYPKAEELYLEQEGAVINMICDELENNIPKTLPVVVDTTGSLIYLDKTLLKRLANLTRIVYLNLPTEKNIELFKAYLQDPKPIIWEGKYLPREGESSEETLGRCFGELLNYRNGLYGSISDCVLDYSFHHSPKTGVSEFLDSVGNCSKQKMLYPNYK